MNYIGSKYSLIDNITSLIQSHIPIEGGAVDLFSGTSTVAQALKNMGFQTYANDWQFYSFITAHSYLHFDDYPQFDFLLQNTNIQEQYRAKFPDNQSKRQVHSLYNRGREIGEHNAFKVLWFLENLQGQAGTFFEEYCEEGKAGRLYFSKENGLKIQAIGDQITLWYREGFISISELYWLRASLIESADRIANTASVYGAYLKKVKKTAQKRLELIAPAPVKGPAKKRKHQAFCSDASKVFTENQLPNITLTYIDPPYNHRQYSGNYHILETLAHWDMGSFTPRGKTGLRDTTSQSSPFCSRTKAYDAFDMLFSSINSKYILFSYNNEGLISEDNLRALFDKHCSNVAFFKHDYGRFKADIDGENRNYTASSVVEFLILGEKNTPI